MKIDTLFLSVEENEPLGVFWANEYGAGIFDFDKFLSLSLIGMSDDQSNRYIERLKKFILELKNKQVDKQ